MELGPHGVTVNALIPGLVDAPLTRYEARNRQAVAKMQATPPGHPTPEQVREARKVSAPLKVSWLEPEDISPAGMVTGAEDEVAGRNSAHSV